MERETNLPSLHLPAPNFLKIWHLEHFSVCVRAHVCMCVFACLCVKSKNLNLRNEALYYENIPRCLWRHFLSAVQTQVTSLRRSGVVSLCVSNNVSDVYENMELWVCMYACVHVSPYGCGCIRGCGMCMQHAWRGRRTTLVHSSGVIPMLLETRSVPGQGLQGRGRGQASWPTSLLLPPLPGWDYRSMSPILAFACYMGSGNWNVSSYPWKVSTLLAEPSPQLWGPFLKILSECHANRIKI